MSYVKSSDNSDKCQNQVFFFYFPTYAMILPFQICKRDSKAKARKRTISMRSLDQHYMLCHRQNVLYVDILVAIVVIASWYVAKKTITLIEAFKTKIRADFCIHMWDFLLNFQLIFFRKCFEYFKCWFSTWAFFVVVFFVKPMLVSFT